MREEAGSELGAIDVAKSATILEIDSNIFSRDKDVESLGRHMAKLCQVYDTLTIVLVLISASLSLLGVNGEVCIENIGLCDADCDTKCKSKHAGGEGYCGTSNNVFTCKCYYNCGVPPRSLPPPPAPPTPPPKNKTCNVGIGRCSAACDEKCCNEDCAAKYPGPKEGYGKCLNTGPPNYIFCTCYFNC